MTQSKSSGTLKSYPLARLLLFAHRKGYQGALQLATRPVTTIFFDRGRPVFVDHVSTDDLLGQLVVLAKLADRELVSRALERQEAERKLLGHILVDLGLDPEALGRVLGVQQKRKLTRLFLLEDAPFQFLDLKLPEVLAQDAAVMAQDPESLVWQVLSTLYTSERFLQELAVLEPMRLSLPTSPSLPFELTRAQSAALARLTSGNVSLRDLESAGRTKEIRALVYWLWASGILQVDLPHDAPKGATQLPRMTSMFRAVSQEHAAPEPKPSETQPTRRAEPGPEPEGTTRSRQAPTSKASQSVPKKPTWPFPPLPENASEEARALYEAIRTRYMEVHDQDLFQVLGVPRDATKTQIKEAYLALAKKFHPDRAANLGGDELRAPADALFQRISEAYMTLSDDAEREEYRRILEDDSLAGDPDRARLLMQAELDFQKGEVFFRKGDLDQAEVYFKRALEENPEEGEHLALVAWTKYLKAKKQKQEARLLPETKKALEKAVELSPKCARIHYFLGKIHQALGSEDEALESFHRAVKLNKHYLEPAREIHIIELRRGKRSTQKSKKSSLWDRLKGK